jgi:hypothetical protein
VSKAYTINTNGSDQYNYDNYEVEGSGFRLDMDENLIIFDEDGNSVAAFNRTSWVAIFEGGAA